MKEFIETTISGQGVKGGGNGADAQKRSVKGYTLQARITGPMRAALQAEADATGRSLSQVACLWLELARRLPPPQSPRIIFPDWDLTSNAQAVADTKIIEDAEV